MESILAAAGDGILAVSRDGQVLQTNRRFAELWRIPPELLGAQPHQALLAFVVDQLSDPTAFVARVRALYDSDDELTDTVTFKDGRVFERFTAPLLFKGVNQGRVWSFRDISERRRAEAALVESRNLLQTIVDTAPLRVFWKDRDLRYLGCNPAFAADAGKRTPAEVIGRVDSELAWADQAERYRADDRAVMTSGVAKLGYEEPQSASGEHKWLRTSKVPLQSHDHQTIGVLGIYEDVTERRRVEQRLNRVIEVTQVVLWELDLLSGHLSYDRNLMHLLGLDDGSTLDSLHAWAEAIHPDDRQAFLESVGRALLPGDALFDFEYRMGSALVPFQWIHTRGRVVQRDGSGRATSAVGSSINITARKEIEAARARSDERIKRLEGIVSICMHCKKIRAEDNAWQQLERYISDHTDATFSHGICPNCAKTHWSD